MKILNSKFFIKQWHQEEVLYRLLHKTVLSNSLHSFPSLVLQPRSKILSALLSVLQKIKLSENFQQTFRPLVLFILYETNPLSTFISPRSNTNLGLILHIWSTTSSVLKPNYWRHYDSKVPQIKTTLVGDQCCHNMVNSVETVQNFQIIFTFQPITNHFKKPESMSAVVTRRPKVLNEIWNWENRLTHVDHSGHRLLVKQVTRRDQKFRTANKITSDNTIYRLLKVWK